MYHASDDSYIRPLRCCPIYQVLSRQKQLKDAVNRAQGTHNLIHGVTHKSNFEGGLIWTRLVTKRTINGCTNHFTVTITILNDFNVTPIVMLRVARNLTSCGRGCREARSKPSPGSPSPTAHLFPSRRFLHPGCGSRDERVGFEVDSVAFRVDSVAFWVESVCRVQVESAGLRVKR